MPAAVDLILLARGAGNGAGIMRPAARGIGRLAAPCRALAVRTGDGAQVHPGAVLEMPAAVDLILRAAGAGDGAGSSRAGAGGVRGLAAPCRVVAARARNAAGANPRAVLEMPTAVDLILRAAGAGDGAGVLDAVRGGGARVVVTFLGRSGKA